MYILLCTGPIRLSRVSAIKVFCLRAVSSVFACPHWSGAAEDTKSQLHNIQLSRSLCLLQVPLHSPCHALLPVIGTFVYFHIFRHLMCT